MYFPITVNSEKEWLPMQGCQPLQIFLYSNEFQTILLQSNHINKIWQKQSPTMIYCQSSSIKPITRNHTPTIITPVNWQSESTSCLSSIPQNMTSKCFIIFHNIEKICLPLIRSIFKESIMIHNLYFYEDLPNTTTCHIPRWRILLLMPHVS